MLHGFRIYKIVDKCQRAKLIFACFSLPMISVTELPILDLETIILSKMSKNIDGDWQCKDCFKTSKVKTNIFEHIEANHVDSPGYQCELCYKFCRTRNALRNHKNFKHKQIKNF